MSVLNFKFSLLFLTVLITIFCNCKPKKRKSVGTQVFSGSLQGVEFNLVGDWKILKSISETIRTPIPQVKYVASFTGKSDPKVKKMRQEIKAAIAHLEKLHPSRLRDSTKTVFTGNQAKTFRTLQTNVESMKKILNGWLVNLKGNNPRPFRNFQDYTDLVQRSYTQKIKSSYNTLLSAKVDNAVLKQMVIEEYKDSSQYKNLSPGQALDDTNTWLAQFKSDSVSTRNVTIAKMSDNYDELIGGRPQQFFAKSGAGAFATTTAQNMGNIRQQQLAMEAQRIKLENIQKAKNNFVLRDFFTAHKFDPSVSESHEMWKYFNKDLIEEFILYTDNLKENELLSLHRQVLAKLQGEVGKPWTDLGFIPKQKLGDVPFHYIMNVLLEDTSLLGTVIVKKLQQASSDLETAAEGLANKKTPDTSMLDTMAKFKSELEFLSISKARKPLEPKKQELDSLIRDIFAPDSQAQKILEKTGHPQRIRFKQKDPNKIVTEKYFDKSQNKTLKRPMIDPITKKPYVETSVMYAGSLGTLFNAEQWNPVTGKYDPILVKWVPPDVEAGLYRDLRSYQKTLAKLRQARVLAESNSTTSYQRLLDRKIDRQNAKIKEILTFIDESSLKQEAENAKKLGAVYDHEIQGDGDKLTIKMAKTTEVTVDMIKGDTLTTSPDKVTGQTKTHTGVGRVSDLNLPMNRSQKFMTASTQIDQLKAGVAYDVRSNVAAQFNIQEVASGKPLGYHLKHMSSYSGAQQAQIKHAVKNLMDIHYDAIFSGKDFHGDMHDENIFIKLRDAGTVAESVTLIDAGTMKSIKTSQRWALTELLTPRMQFLMRPAYIKEMKRMYLDPNFDFDGYLAGNKGDIGEGLRTIQPFNVGSTEIGKEVVGLQEFRKNTVELYKEMEKYMGYLSEGKWALNPKSWDDYSAFMNMLNGNGQKVNMLQLLTLNLHGDIAEAFKATQVAFAIIDKAKKNPTNFQDLIRSMEPEEIMSYTVRRPQPMKMFNILDTSVGIEDPIERLKTAPFSVDPPIIHSKVLTRNGKRALTQEEFIEFSRRVLIDNSEADVFQLRKEILELTEELNEFKREKVFELEIADPIDKEHEFVEVKKDPKLEKLEQKVARLEELNNKLKMQAQNIPSLESKSQTLAEDLKAIKKVLGANSSSKADILEEIEKLKELNREGKQELIKQRELLTDEHQKEMQIIKEAKDKIDVKFNELDAEHKHLVQKEREAQTLIDSLRNELALEKERVQLANVDPNESDKLQSLKQSLEEKLIKIRDLGKEIIEKNSQIEGLLDEKKTWAKQTKDLEFTKEELRKALLREEKLIEEKRTLVQNAKKLEEKILNIKKALAGNSNISGILDPAQEIEKLKEELKVANQKVHDFNEQKKLILAKDRLLETKDAKIRELELKMKTAESKHRIAIQDMVPKSQQSLESKFQREKNLLSHEIENLKKEKLRLQEESQKLNNTIASKDSTLEELRNSREKFREMLSLEHAKLKEELVRKGKQYEMLDGKRLREHLAKQAELDNSISRLKSQGLDSLKRPDYDLDSLKKMKKGALMFGAGAAALGIGAYILYDAVSTREEALIEAETK